MKTKHILLILTFVVGLWGGNQLIKMIASSSQGQQAADAMVEQKNPEFTLPDIDGVQHNIREWQGNVIVLNFWATWCPPCRKETPMFVELQEEWGSRGLQFVGVAIDEINKVKEFMDTYGVNYPMLIGVDDAIEISKAYGNRFGALPYTVIIDRKGNIAHVQRGELERNVAEKTIKALL
ncbi:TlpA family protein disulfide reductase [Kaarinaea lacus]